MHDKKLNVMNSKYYIIAQNLSSYQKKLYLMRCFNMESFNYISNNSWIEFNYFFVCESTLKLRITEINQDLLQSALIVLKVCYAYTSSCIKKNN